MGSQKKHQEMQKNLVERLQAKGYTRIYENVEYHILYGDTVLDGEVDVIALSPTDKETWHFYEVKSGKHRYTKAQNQFYRYKVTHPSLPIKGIYVGADGVKRLV